MKPPALAVAAPERVSALLAESDGPVPIVHRGAHAVYVEVAGRCIGVVAAGASAVPCALRVASPDLRDLASAASARVAYGALRFDETALRVGRVLDVTAPSLAVGAAARMTGLVDLVPGHVREALPVGALGRLAAGDPSAVPALVGLGEGLTPLGDDVLCGWLALRHAVGAPSAAIGAAVRDHLDRTTLLSATLLDCALHGEVLPEYADLLRSLDSADETRRVAAAHALVRVGHTSGAGLLLGAALAARDLAAPALSTRSTPITISEGRRCA